MTTQIELPAGIFAGFTPEEIQECLSAGCSAALEKATELRGLPE